MPGHAPAQRVARAVLQVGYGSSSSGPALHRARRPRPAGPPFALRRNRGVGWASRAWSTMAGERPISKASNPKSCSMAVRRPGPHPTSATRKFPVSRTSPAKGPIMFRAKGRVVDPGNRPPPAQTRHHGSPRSALRRHRNDHQPCQTGSPPTPRSTWSPHQHLNRPPPHTSRRCNLPRTLARVRPVNSSGPPLWRPAKESCFSAPGHRLRHRFLRRAGAARSPSPTRRRAERGT